MRKVALTADLQFQSQPRYSTLGSSGVTTRLEDFVRCFDWIVDTAVAEGCDALFILGDLLDSRTVIDVSVIDFVCRAFQRASSRLDVHVLVGNHDTYLRSPRINSTQMLSGWAEVHESFRHVPPFVLVPWTDNAEDYHRLFERADKLRKKKRDDARFLLSHGMFGDAVPMAKGLPLDWLTKGKWDGVFLGDVHDPVVLRTYPVIRYVGSPLQIHFGDAARSRGFLVLDTEGGLKWIENEISPRFHVLRELADVKKAKPATARDFFRIAADDPDLVATLAEKARELTPWVEASAVEAADASAVRIQAAGSMSDQELLTAYCKLLDTNPDLLVGLGLELLHEARSA